MRIAVGQIWQETNTLNPIVTTRDDFSAFGVMRGDEVIERMAETNELGGFIQTLRTWDDKPEIAGLVRLAAWPGGTATEETFDWIKAELLESLERALPADGILLALHGALVADKHPDVEGELLQMVRQRIGSELPLVATLDLHANVTENMVQAADALVLYHCAPHVDVFQTGCRATGVLQRMLYEQARPATAFQKIPLVLPPENANTESDSGVSVDLKRTLQELEASPPVLCAGIATVQPWMDIPQLGSSVVVATDGDQPLARHECARLAGELWRRRREYLPELVTIEQAVLQAHQCPAGLTVLSDSADATTSGAPGDSVWILKELLRYDWPRPALVPLVAPAIVQLAERLGSGARGEFQLGGVRDTRFGTSIALEATVERLFDGRFVLSGHLGTNMPIDMGRCAVLRHQDVAIVVTSRSGPHFAPELFRAAGYDPFAASVLVAKSPCGFRAAYADRAAQILVVQAPGCAPSDFWNYPFRHIPRPLWPWDELEDF